MTELAQDPAQIGPFVVLRKLGEGAMGVVYAGFDVQLDRKVAIKLVHRHLLDRPEVRLRMTREAQAMARLSSPHVVHVYQVGEHDDGIYMAMEYIDGHTLGAWLRARPRPWQLVLRTVCDAGRGLAAAHHAGLTHRDFKPDNVLVDADGRARVLDFGLAQTDAAGQQEQAMAQPETTATTEEEERPLGADIHWSVRLTEHGKALGTPAYMSPEQHFGGLVGPHSDQFNFSITLYEALYGYRPFYGDTWQAIKQHVMRGVVPPPPMETRVPKRVYRALVRGLAIAPDARWPSLDAMLDALEHDPWRVRVRVAGVAGLIGVASVASYAVAVTQLSPEARCDSTAELVGVWDHARKAAVARAFTATRAPFAAEVQERTLARLDAYAATWTAEHTAVCEANTAGRQTSHVMDLRGACLGRHKSQVAALVDIFTEADRAVVEHAVQAVAGLPSVKACADVDGLLTAVPPPSDPTTAARVEELRERLARATSLEATGQYEQGVQLAAQVRAEARILGYAPLDAEAALVEGKLLMEAMRAETADAALAHALRVAITHDLHTVAAEAAVRRLFVISEGLGRPAEALVTRPIAEALVERASGDGQLAALLSNNLGAVYEHAGDVPAARGHYERSLELLQRSSAGDPLIVVIHHNLGGMYLDEGQLGQARLHYNRALELSRELLGARHPLAAHPLAGLGDVDFKEGAPAHAQVMYGEALALMEASYGPDNLYLLHPLAGLGKVAATGGASDDARRYYERAVSIADHHGASHPLLAESLVGLAELAAQGRDPSRMQALFERAMTVYAASGDPGGPHLAATAQKAGELAAQLGERDAAIAWFERVLATPEDVADRPRSIALATLRLATLLVERTAEVPRACALVAGADAALPTEDRDAGLHAELRALQTARCEGRPRRQ